LLRTYLLLFLLSGIANFGFTFQILRELARAGIRLNPFDLRWQVIKHLKTYRQVSRQRLGHIGWAHHGYVATLGFLIIFGILSLDALLK